MFGFSGWDIWVSWNVAICHWQMSKGSCKCVIWVCLSKRQDKSRSWGHLKKMIWTLTWFAAGCLFLDMVFWCWNLCNLEQSTQKIHRIKKVFSKPVILITHNFSCWNFPGNSTEATIGTGMQKYHTNPNRALYLSSKSLEKSTCICILWSFLNLVYLYNHLRKRWKKSKSGLSPKAV